MNPNVQFHSDLTKLIEILPPKITNSLKREQLYDVIEIVMDLGRFAEVRYPDNRTQYISSEPIEQADLDFVTSRIQDFTSDNRSGITGTLHRISAIKNRQNKVVGLTCRIGRVVTGTIECIKDIVLTGKSILFLGRPGVGKTTKLREISRLIADELNKRVVIVDTSNEIAGDGDTPHFSIGRARRMQVREPEFQKDIMIEAVENHTPQVIVVDEIGTEAEAQAARTIAERGVMLVATAHGNTLENLIKNPVLSDLVGGVSSVTLGDDEAKRRGSQKTVLEREKQPTFDVVIEIIDRNTLAVYQNTAEAVDYILRGWPIRPEIRRVDESYDNNKHQEPVQIVTPIEQKLEQKQALTQAPFEPKFAVPKSSSDSLKFSFSRKDYANEVKAFKKIYIYAVSRSIVEKVIERLDLNAEITRTVEDADVVIAHKNFAKGGAKVLSTANEYRIQIFYVKTNSMAQIQKVMKEALDIQDSSETLKGYYDEAERALDEAKAAIEKIQKGENHIELTPQNQKIRKLQHELIEQHNLESQSIGEGADRHLRIVGGKEFSNAHQEKDAS